MSKKVNPRRRPRPRCHGPLRHQQVSSIQEVHRIPGGMRKAGQPPRRSINSCPAHPEHHSLV